MEYGTSNVEYLDVIDADLSTEDCNNIIGENGTTYNASYRDATYARIDTAGTPGYFTNILGKQ